jgi:uncharacterized protein (TIGR02145 family)
MIINPLLPVSIVITPSASTICPGTLVTFTSSVTNGGTTPFYQWKINGFNVSGATNNTYAYNVSNNDLITCVLTSNALCATGTPATSNQVSMTVNPFAPVSVTIVASTPIVTGTAVTFTATPVNGGTSPVYQWKVNGINAGSNSSTYSYIPAINDKITCVLTSTLSCTIGVPATSNNIIITGTPLVPISIRITPSANSVCSGTNVTFTSVVLNGGTAPTYQWKLNGTNITGATNATYSVVPVNLSAITCAMTGAGNTATSNTITMSVVPLTTVNVTIAASFYAVMPGALVTYTATPVNQGTVPVYQWKVNSVNAGTNSNTFTYAPADHDKITCVLTSNSNASCLSNNPATSTAITMVVYTIGSPCTTAPTVSYGGLTYNSVQIGTQCWLRESINIGTKVPGTANQLNNNILEKYCYLDNEENCNVYGGLYQWAEMVQYLSGATNTANWNPVPTGNVQGICPAGWHIPTNTEWGTLTAFLGTSNQGAKIKEMTYAHFNSPNTGATNSSGFTALPGGLRWSTGLFYYIRMDANYWTVTTPTVVPPALPSPTDIFYAGASYGSAVMNSSQFIKATGLSVRCLKD